MPAEPVRQAREAETQGTGVTTEQLEAILNVLDVLIDHADRVATHAQVVVVAARDLANGTASEQDRQDSSTISIGSCDYCSGSARRSHAATTKDARARLPPAKRSLTLSLSLRVSCRPGLARRFLFGRRRGAAR